MAGRITLTMIKPDAVAKNYTGSIVKMIGDAGFRIAAMKLMHLTPVQAARFYEVHKGKPFYEPLVAFMSSGPIVAALLEKENAIADFRELIGATNPANAAPGTVRALFATDVQRNAVHGSDSDENAIIESDFFFSGLERY
ncbi:MAG: nucleoside-diphosphate kinase [Prolixibacteraceae bacterium]|jgi:nucleoside-diphosphate kinase|nr:nucleoside-diphosphate kinase [Prolixibacteraceae bacterium]MDI9564579.1 nucleoside-diphosphate kinase [Bacteroidota bacterium]NLT00629.1 nucleoside-diphosphate kinase [Bacteroidales bacterium]OQB79982.1 MAG: Nucleoside diphosphate kinase [Bacteroidetes bacterium ADurb.Bin123]HNU78380.1 nucleoside-diphosphate kinase [Prolixibacteraceae bacterium]